MKSAHLVALGAAAVVAVGAVVALNTGGSGSGTVSSERLFPALAAKVNDVATVVVARKDDTTTIVRKGEVWTVSDKSDYPAAFDKVRKLLVELAELRPLEQKTSTPDLFASLELEDLSQADAKSTVVTLKDTGGADLLSVVVGKVRVGRGGASGDGVYVRKASENQTWLAKGRLSLERGDVNWVDRVVIDVPRERVAKATLVQPDGAKLVVSRPKATEKNLTLDAVPAGRKAKEWDVNQAAAAFERLELDDVRPMPASVEPKQYAEVATFDGLIARADIVELDGQPWVKISARFETPAAAPSEEEVKEAKLKSADEVKKDVEALNAKTAPWLYRLPDWKTDNMRKKVADLLEEEKKDDSKS
jgi:hypothetical protein